MPHTQEYIIKLLWTAMLKTDSYLSGTDPVKKADDLKAMEALMSEAQDRIDKLPKKRKEKINFIGSHLADLSPDKIMRFIKTCKEDESKMDMAADLSSFVEGTAPSRSGANGGKSA
ncbi:hypothetical protein LTR36_006766 [Oleoguttula mirabilis]|uniref:Uncharacterized protein n=1 Tax=Oleoguttula mirabilis TaxID=1507867 RepID=A0AAV9JBW5_9PEZI|nr:hypothetical protein LTR36_006766 [Oleoguttula mirabilis]